ncbi:hypothetical protein MTR67_018678 [Solanum verrucosum]|uniref:Uncharacterized protein n=1 Tax=Solanum verrucosum TaxID=315347 RepID=A0AAF0QN00_SOLVR|nr:hypothetical protein MTR67_018678 [Solanum verrucosum]
MESQLYYGRKKRLRP